MNQSLELHNNIFSCERHLCIVLFHLHLHLVNYHINLRVYLVHHGLKPSTGGLIVTLLSPEFLHLSIEICLLELLEARPKVAGPVSHEVIGF
jgi:hypothetical protein